MKKYKLNHTIWPILMALKGSGETLSGPEMPKNRIKDNPY